MHFLSLVPKCPLYTFHFSAQQWLSLLQSPKGTFACVGAHLTPLHHANVITLCYDAIMLY